MMRRLTHASIAVALSVVPRLALAQSAEESARRSFTEGMELEATDPAAACGKFRQALGLVREIGPLLKVKDCDVREGKLLAAREKLKELTGRWPAKDEQREALVKELASVEARIVRLKLTLATGAPEGMRVRMDEAVVAMPASAVELDPGEHVLQVEAPGRTPSRTTLTFADGEKRTIELPRPDEWPATEEPGKVTPPGVTRPTGEPESELQTLGYVGISIGALGAAALIGGGVTGGMVLSQKDEFDACKAAPTSDCDLLDLQSSGDALLTANGVLLIGGGVLFALGATLLVVDLVDSPADDAGPAQPAVSLELGPTAAQAVLTW